MRVTDDYYRETIAKRLDNALREVLSSRSSIATCANCGKEGKGDDMNTCNKCNKVKYCNATCKKKHRKKHKNKCVEMTPTGASMSKLIDHLLQNADQCEEQLVRAKELHELELFKQPPPEEECSICFIRVPTMPTGKRYESCCAKLVCCGCSHACQMTEGDIKCAFCRKPTPASAKESRDQERARVMGKEKEVDDANAICNLASDLFDGERGLSVNHSKAFDLWLHAGKELNHGPSYFAIAQNYLNGHGVRRDLQKAIFYWELSAMCGSVRGRRNLGANEWKSSNFDKALKHWMIAVRDGDERSLKDIQKMYKDGHATKDEYAEALNARQSYLDEIRTFQRDEAAAFHSTYKYY